MSDSAADDFINIWADSNPVDNEFHRNWSTLASAKFASPHLQAVNALRKIYPDHSIVGTFHNLLKFPAVLSSPLPNAPQIGNVIFIPQGRENGQTKGALVDQIEFGAFAVAWDKYDFIVYVASYPSGFGSITMFFILHEGPQGPARSLILKSGLWAESLHDEIWVYNQGWWQKDHQLWVDIQSADWKDVILKDEFKKALHKDVYGFFKSEPIYKELAIPWKRGLIMHGPPVRASLATEKTISIKVIMKTCDEQGFAPLYVKSFQNYAGEEAAMAQVFDKARQLSPCVIVLEDLDALINDRNRSFFLNQLDGLQGNDGLLVIGTTNHFERLDPGLSTRPSRFDRKYLFDDPDLEERKLYVRYWQDKLKINKGIEFPDALVDEVAEQTEQFSFAYLKEAFVSTLVTLAGWEGDDKPTFSRAVKDQIKILRKQLDKVPSASQGSESNSQSDSEKRDFRSLFDTLSDRSLFSVFPPSPLNSNMPVPMEGDVGGGRQRDFRALLDRLQSMPMSPPGQGQSEADAGRDRDFRVLLDRLNDTPEMMAHLEARVADARRRFAELNVPGHGPSAYFATLSAAQLD
ncbi:P-loop containing nucleoside triphosphate hydrolase protein [Mycena alexandri]|uniref:P-loop containing nucleoside triphosphate hydrolase protein n=1 Tax=Mycena alexandri TaxID=1745969 RepID=A0AAD6TG27_9AGAR|nr:P-loop containing nucleoside triphosphate hydrolase protein [Mycena alexandri]